MSWKFKHLSNTRARRSLGTERPFGLDITDMPCSTESNQRDSPLLRLPPEVRNSVYTYAFLNTEIDFLDEYLSSPHYSHIPRTPLENRAPLDLLKT